MINGRDRKPTITINANDGNENPEGDLNRPRRKGEAHERIVGTRALYRDVTDTRNT